ncbi:G-protein-signaling modulator 1 [Oryzias melastigma]|uniref:G-protein-signaling modulator 1 n=1 Tax=Oryzias melastigma TaxID=30732 RepID=A0A834EX01_ORYME|nr:G-protein-signaling modulator 1 [Oryzias melastigma]
MAEKEQSSLSSSTPAAHKSRRTGGAAFTCSPKAQHNGSPGLGDSSSKPEASASPLRAFAGLMFPAATSSSEGRSGSSRPRGQSLGSAPNSRNKSSTFKRKLRSSQQGETEALLDLILESQCQRLDDQRASLSLLPDQDAASLCGACSSDQALDFYCMLIHYQSDRMEDQRCSLPDLDEMMVPVPEGQEDFFCLLQRVQSKRIDEQRASMLLRHAEDQDEEEEEKVPPST